MKPTSLISIRKRSVISGITVMVILCVAVFGFFMWGFVSYHKFQAERILRDMTTWMEEHMAMTEAFLERIDLHKIDESAMDAMKVKGMILCSHDGVVTKVFRGNREIGGHFPVGLLTGKWQVASFLGSFDFPKMIFSTRIGGSYLLAGFDSRFFFPDPYFLKESNSSLILMNKKGMIITAWGERGVPIGGQFPLELLEDVPKMGIWDGVRVGVHLAPIADDFYLVQVLPIRWVLMWSAGVAFLWTAMTLIFFMPFFGYFWWVLYRITGYLGSSVRSIWETVENISPDDTDIETASKVFEALESFRTVETPFEEYNRLLNAIERILSVISEQGENLTSLYEEAVAMDGLLRENNDMLNMANEKLEGLVNLSKNLEESPSLDSAVDGIAFNLAATFHCGFVAVVAFKDEIPFIWARRGTAPKDLESEDLFELTASFSDKESSVIQTMADYVRTVAPVRFMGHMMGLIIMTNGENLHGDYLIEVMNRFTPMVGGIFYAYGMLREVRKSFHYLAIRMQTLTSEYHDETGSHLSRVGEYSAVIAKGLGMPSEYVEDIRIYSQLHDIGKLKVPMEVLGKPGSLTDTEFKTIQRHVEYGADILGDSEWLEMARQVVMTHHEKWDGTGYPKGLKGTQIPLSGRIVALADVYDALRCARAYKPAFSHEKTCKIILEGDGRVMPQHFDPDILEFFKNNNEKFNEIYEEIKEEIK